MFGARWRESVVLNMLMLSAYPIEGTKGLLSVPRAIARSANGRRVSKIAIYSTARVKCVHNKRKSFDRVTMEKS